MKLLSLEPKAFISWSLCPEDEPFICFIEEITRDFGFETFRPVYVEEENSKSLKDQIIAGSHMADCTLIATTPSYLLHLCDKQNIGWQKVMETLTGNFHPIMAFLSSDLYAEKGIHPMIQSITLGLRNPNEIRAKYPLLRYFFNTIQQTINPEKNQDDCQKYLKDVDTAIWKRYCN